MIERLDAHADAVNCAEDTFFQPNTCPGGDVSCYPSEAFKYGKISTDFGSNPTYEG